mmetsp:Transcript_17553/g.31751  ORF Transcript_17553/g.31751 Transcript_17553/m.31751 type:complete len:210 (-) Transcript_17553:352-981(-)
MHRQTQSMPPWSMAVVVRHQTQSLPPLLLVVRHHRTRQWFCRRMWRTNRTSTAGLRKKMMTTWNCWRQKECFQNHHQIQRMAGRRTAAVAVGRIQTAAAVVVVVVATALMIVGQIQRMVVAMAAVATATMPGQILLPIGMKKVGRIPQSHHHLHFRRLHSFLQTLLHRRCCPWHYCRHRQTLLHLHRWKNQMWLLEQRWCPVQNPHRHH